MRKIIIQFFFITILLIFFCSCSENLDTKKYLIISEEKISIPIDMKTISTSKSLRFAEINKKPFLIYQSGNRELQFYNLNNLEKEDSIVIQKEGPNRISKISGFYFINSDSIITLGSCKSELLLLNKKAEIIKHFDLNIKDDAGIEIVPNFLFTGLNNEIFIKNNYLYFTLRNVYTPSTFTELKKVKLMARINISNNSVEILELSYPDELEAENNKYYPSYLSHVFDGKYSVFSFEASSYIYYTNGHKEFEKTNVPSKFQVKGFVPYLPYSSSGEKKAMDLLTYSSYPSLYYNKYKKVYYRFFYPGYEFDNYDDIFNLIKYRKQFSVMVLDENFDIIDEILMPENTFNMNMAFVSPKGLWISTNHIKNPDFEEDFLKFTLLKLVDN